MLLRFDKRMKSVMKAMREGFVSTYGPYVTAFEKSLSDFMGGGYPVAVQSGTAALHLALLEARDWARGMR